MGTTSSSILGVVVCLTVATARSFKRQGGRQGIQVRDTPGCGLLDGSATARLVLLLDLFTAMSASAFHKGHITRSPRACFRRITRDTGRVISLRGCCGGHGKGMIRLLLLGSKVTSPNDLGESI